jgi:predicted HAD superfamily Cof-like phosphohydrolase
MTEDRTLLMVQEFHQAFDLPHSQSVHVPEPGTLLLKAFAGQLNHMAELLKQVTAGMDPDKREAEVRCRIILEEMGELLLAISEGDLVETLDALGDLRYVLDGTAVSFGLDQVFDDAFDEVHRSNMSKLVDGKPLKDDSGKVIKPDTYSPPDLVSILDHATHNQAPIAADALGMLQDLADTVVTGGNNPARRAGAVMGSFRPLEFERGSITEENDDVADQLRQEMCSNLDDDDTASDDDPNWAEDPDLGAK